MLDDFYLTKTIIGEGLYTYVVYVPIVGIQSLKIKNQKFWQPMFYIVNIVTKNNL